MITVNGSSCISFLNFLISFSFLSPSWELLSINMPLPLWNCITCQLLPPSQQQRQVTPMIQHHVTQCNVCWLRLVCSCIMSCSWSDATVALIILFSSEREREKKSGGRGRRGQTEDPLRMGRTSRGPLCAPAQNKRKEPTWGGGGAAFWVGRERWDGCGAQRDREKKFETERES